MAVQECTMYVEWPTSALKYWSEERGSAGELLFRGPRSVYTAGILIMPDCSCFF
jgi:hypothetical protein